jgi:integrase
MPRIKLTVKSVAGLKAPTPTGKQQLHWDSELKGFGLLLSGVSAARTYVVQRDLPGGRTRRVTIGPANVLPLDEARKRAEAVLAEFYLGKDPKSGRNGAATLQETLDEYLKARKNLRPKTISIYTDAIVRCLQPWLQKPLRSITPDMVEAYHQELAEKISAGGRYTGGAMANTALKTLSTLWVYAAKRDPDLPPNPVQRLERQWFPVHRRVRLVRAEELPRFYKAVTELENPIARDYLLLLLFTGLRRTEAATLTWDDVDFTNKVLRVPASSTKAGRKLDLPMTDVVHALLLQRRQLGNAKFVFPANGRRGHISAAAFPLHIVGKDTGIHVSAHDLRRTYITTAEACDISWSALKLLVNHSLGGITGGYVVLSVDRLRAPAQQVCDRLKELCGVVDPTGANVMAFNKQ